MRDERDATEVHVMVGRRKSPREGRTVVATGGAGRTVEVRLTDPVEAIVREGGQVKKRLR